MKNVKNYSLEADARGNNSLSTEHRELNTTTALSDMYSLPTIEEGHKLVRRYSFDDNGGGYEGL